MRATKSSLFLVHLETGQRYPLKGSVTIGRAHGDIVFARDKELSPEHCRVLPTPKGVSIQDLKSKAGTLVNGIKLEPGRAYLLKPGDEFAVSEQAFMLHEVSLSHRARRKPRRKRLNPSFLSLYAILLMNLLVFAWAFLHGTPWLNPSPEQMINAGAAVNSLITDGQSWRLITSVFLHYGLVHLACNLWAVYMLAEFLVASLGDGSFLLLYFASGFTGVLLTMGLGDGSEVAAGASGAVAGIVGGIFASHILRRTKLKRVSALSWLALFACVVQNVFFLKGGLVSLAHLGALLVGFVLALLIHWLESDLRQWKQIPLTATLAALTLALLSHIPHKANINQLSPAQSMQKEFSEIYENYASLRSAFEHKTAPQKQVAQRLRSQILPRIDGLTKRLPTLPVETESQRFVLELQQRFLAAMAGQAESIAKFNESADPKFQDEIDAWSERFDQIHGEFLQLPPNTQTMGLSLPATLQSPFQLAEREMRKMIRDYRNLGTVVQGHQINEAQMAENIRNDLLPKIETVRARLAVIVPKGEAERRKWELDQRVVNAYAGQLKSMAAFADTKDLKYSREIETWGTQLEKLTLELKGSQARQPAGREPPR